MTGTAEVLAAFLARGRAGIRVDGLPLLAGHGMADPAYRPPRLPYLSVVGPLAFELEPEREPPRAVALPVQTPGYLAGAARAATDPVPAAGPVRLRLDGDAEGTVEVDPGPLAGQPLPEAGPQVAAVLEAAIRAAAFTAGGAPVTDPARLAELAAVTARWDGAGPRLVVASGRRGVLGPADPGRPSGVEVLDPAGTVAAGLGLGAGAVAVPGHVVRHRRPNPTAVAVDVRVDLWAGSQRDLAAVADAWLRITPTRGTLLARPALLAADLEPGGTTIRLQPGGEGATRWTLLQLELYTAPGPARLVDRLTGAPVRVGGTAGVDSSGLRIGPGASATVPFFDPPPVPYAWLPDHPGEDGYAVSLGLQAVAGAAGLRVLALQHAGADVVTLDLEPANGGVAPARLTGRAQRSDGGAFAEAVGTVDPAALAAGVEVHVTVDAATGRVALFADGVPAPPPAGTVPAAGQPARPAGGPGMLLVLGEAAGGGPAPAPAPTAVVRHVQVHGRPLGPLDPRARLAPAPATAWSVGEPLSLGRTEDGVTLAGEAFGATVVGIAGDELTLDRPVDGRYPRGSSIVLGRGLFFSQRQLRRHDDLMNQLYRLCLEYRVSTFLDERFPAASAPLVEVADVEVRELAGSAGRPAIAAPGVRALVTTRPFPLPGARHA